MMNEEQLEKLCLEMVQGYWLGGRLRTGQRPGG